MPTFSYWDGTQHVQFTGPQGPAGPAGTGAVSPLTLIANTATEKPLILRGAASQTANLQEWQNSSGTVLASITAFGEIGTTTRISAGALGTESVNTALYAKPLQTTEIGLVVRGRASQTANLAEFQNSAGTVLTRVQSDGSLEVGGVLASVGYCNLASFVQTASVRGLVVRGAASQTANLTEWQDSAGTILASVLSDGRVHSKNQFAVIDSTDPARIKCVLRATASQTANLQEWQNSSGSLLTAVDQNGRYRWNSAVGNTANGASTGANGILPSQVGGYLIATIDGNPVKIPWYNN